VRRHFAAGYRSGVDHSLETERLMIRAWTADDADAALEIYGAADVTRWLTPAMDRVVNQATMRSVLQAWEELRATATPPRGRWAVERKEDGVVVGGLGIKLLPPFEEDLEISWQLRPEAWGQGYATEAGSALIRWAFTQDIDELFAVARPDNTRAIATAERLGMTWVGETSKYYDLTLQVFRIRPSDL
jgi:RimJ/RimL family protein N-acetyltransferase